MSTDSAANPIWDFALTLYETPGVPEACVSLQDRCGVDVGFALASVWLGRRGARAHVCREPLATAWRATRPLHTDVLDPVRQARRNLKPLLETLPDALRDHAAALRKQLAGQEMALERLQYALVHRELARVEGAAEHDARAIFAHYLELAELTLDEQGEADFAQLTRSAA